MSLSLSLFLSPPSSPVSSLSPAFPLPFLPPSLPPPVSHSDAYNILFAIWCREQWEAVISFRFEASLIECIDFTTISNFLRQLPQHVCMTWVKTLCNAWATTSRLHIDPVAPCILLSCTFTRCFITLFQLQQILAASAGGNSIASFDQALGCLRRFSL